jgi:hypothetical protein
METAWLDAADVAYGSKAGVAALKGDVRFAPDSDRLAVVSDVR